MGTQTNGGHGQKTFSTAPVVRPVVSPGGGTTHRSPTTNASSAGSSGSSMSTGTKVLIGAVLALIVFIFFKTMSNVDRTTVDILTSDVTLAVGQTVEVRIESTADKLMAYSDNCFEVEWNNGKNSGNRYYLNVTGVSPGTGVLRIEKSDNASKCDTATITVIAEDSGTQDGTSVEGISEDADLQYLDSNIISLSDLEYWDKSDYGIGPRTSETGITDNLNNTYNTYFCSNSGWNEYSLGGAYSTFEGRFIIEKDYRSSDDNSYLWVYGDGQLLYGATMTGGTKPIDFRVDISGVDILRIRLDSSTANGGYEYTDLVNAYLCKSGYSNLGEDIPVNKIYPDGATSLASLEWWNQDGSIGPYSFRAITDNMDTTYYEYFSANWGWNEYALEGKYSTFVGRLVIEKEYNTCEDSGTVKIYGDGNLLYSGSVTGQQAPVDFSINIAGVQYLKIELDSPTRDGGYEVTDLVNAYLM